MRTPQQRISQVRVEQSVPLIHLLRGELSDPTSASAASPPPFCPRASPTVASPRKSLSAGEDSSPAPWARLSRSSRPPTTDWTGACPSSSAAASGSGPRATRSRKYNRRASESLVAARVETEEAEAGTPSCASLTVGFIFLRSSSGPADGNTSYGIPAR